MKKWFIAFLIFFLLMAAFAYLFIPNVVSVNRSTSVKANAEGLYRSLTISKWKNWWPETNTDHTSVSLGQPFYLSGNTYTIDDKSINPLFISISGNKISAKTLLHIIPLKTDSVKLAWTGSVATSGNPLVRIQRYFRLKKIESDIEKILEQMNLYFSKNENIYGLHIKQESVVDSILISTFAISSRYPTTPFIYELINQLNHYARSNSATATGDPMLNITTKDSINFLTRVAIPVNKRLKDSGNISYKWMLGGGKILVTEIKGGFHSIQKGFKEMDNYVNDYRRLAPAIPFQSMVTDRMKEQDTSKWITRIFYPVM